MHTFYFSIEENRDGQFGDKNCKSYWAHDLVNQAVITGLLMHWDYMY